MVLQSNGQYVITADEITNNSEITYNDLNEIYGEQLDFNLTNASNKTYNIMFSACPNIYRKRNRLALNYIIQNDTDKQAVVRDAIIEYIRGAIYSGMDLREYDKEATNHSKSLKDLLKENDLWVVSQIEYRDEDIE